MGTSLRHLSNKELLASFRAEAKLSINSAMVDEITHRFVSYEVVIKHLRKCCVEALEGKWNRTDNGFKAMITTVDNHVIFPKPKKEEKKDNVLPFRSDATPIKEEPPSTDSNQKGRRSGKGTDSSPEG